MAMRGTRVPLLRQGRQDAAVKIDSQEYQKQTVINPSKGTPLYGYTETLINFESRIGEPFLVRKGLKSKKTEAVLVANGLGTTEASIYGHTPLAAKVLLTKYRRGGIIQTDISASDVKDGKIGANASFGGTASIPTHLGGNQVGQILQVALPPPNIDPAELAKSMPGTSTTRFPFIYQIKTPEAPADKMMSFILEVLNDPKRFRLAMGGGAVNASYENAAKSIFEFILLTTSFAIGETVAAGILRPATTELQENGVPVNAEETTLRIAEFLGVIPKPAKTRTILQRTGTAKKWGQLRQDILRRVLFRGPDKTVNSRYEFGLRRDASGRFISSARNLRARGKTSGTTIINNRHGRLLEKQINCAQRTMAAMYSAKQEDDSWDIARVIKPGNVGSRTFVVQLP